MQMKVDVNTLRLGVNCPLVEQNELNFRPRVWPLPFDFPIITDKDGQIVSRYGDAIWDMTPWNGGVTLRIHFSSASRSKTISDISPENSSVLRKIAAWILYFDRTKRKAKTIYNIIKIIKPIFALCTKEGILASNLRDHPDITEKSIALIAKTVNNATFALLHLIFEFREQLGFTIFEREALRRLSACIREQDPAQTPYIPPRIWTYQLNCLRACIEDFNKHANDISDCYHFCMDAYASNFGSLQNALTRHCKNPHLNPFTSPPSNYASSYGSFLATAKRYRIAALLQQWVLAKDEPIENIDVGYLSRYLNTVSAACLAYILNFSMMRVSEAFSLRKDCLQIENDDLLGQVYFICGSTAKSYPDDNARWVVSPSVHIAVEAASVIATFRTEILASGLKNKTMQVEVANPRLFIPPCEPWASTHPTTEIGSLGVARSYKSLLDTRLSRVFDLNELRITKEDLEIGRLITPSLNGYKFEVGQVWPLAWHQLRRTGMVNMQASGVVSDASMQFQAKHARRTMSIYYGQGYSGVAINDLTRREYIRTMYEMMAKEIDRLFDERFVSPYGIERKAEILHYVSNRDASKLLAAASSGLVTCRETLLGICTRRGPCSYGGIDNIVRCAGGDDHAPCNYALFDQEKKAVIRELIEILDERLLASEVGSALHDSLLAQKRSAENTLGYFARR
jgi:hypothetical protein